jgi:hypothetical protein
MMSPTPGHGPPWLLIAALAGGSALLLLGAATAIDWATCSRWEAQLVEQTDCRASPQGGTRCTTHWVTAQVCVERLP